MENNELVQVDLTLQKYNEINEYFDGKLPNHIHEPIKFAYYLKCYEFYQRRKQNGVLQDA